jgi:hypothetical protein
MNLLHLVVKAEQIALCFKSFSLIRLSKFVSIVIMEHLRDCITLCANLALERELRELGLLPFIPTRKRFSKDLKHQRNLVGANSVDKGARNCSRFLILRRQIY